MAQQSDVQSSRMVSRVLPSMGDSAVTSPPHAHAGSAPTGYIIQLCARVRGTCD
jgi:hypothetical protein